MLRSIPLLLLAAGCASADSNVLPTSATPLTATVLEGRWIVDLRGAPGEAPSTKPFIVTGVDEANRRITGSFYDSEISWSRVNTAWGKLVVTFITSDGQGEYVHTATLQGDTLVGSSTARHRNLLVPWTAARER